MFLKCDLVTSLYKCLILHTTVSIFRPKNDKAGAIPACSDELGHFQKPLY